MRLALVLALAACSSSAPTAPPVSNVASSPPPATAITGADDAIDRFIASWTAEVRPRIPGHRDPLIGQIDASMREPEARARYSAKLERCRDASQNMVDLMAQSHYDFVLHGSMEQANAHERCWSVTYMCCMKGDAGALLDPDSGKLLVVWRIPEG